MLKFHSDEAEDDFDPEIEVEIKGKALLNLPDVKIVTGEENEQVLFKMKVTLLRFRNDEWKERGYGLMKFLQHNTTKKVRCIMRQDKTLRGIANFYVQEKTLCNIEWFEDSDKELTFSAFDVIDGPKVEKFIVKFEETEEANTFKEQFEKARSINSSQKVDQ